MLNEIDQIKPFTAYGEADPDEARRKRMRDQTANEQDLVQSGLADTSMHDSSPGVALRESSPATLIQKSMPSFRHGGVVQRTGIYKLHRGERVIPSRMAQRFGEART